MVTRRLWPMRTTPNLPLSKLIPFDCSCEKVQPKSEGPLECELPFDKNRVFTAAIKIEVSVFDDYCLHCVAPELLKHLKKDARELRDDRAAFGTEE